MFVTRGFLSDFWCVRIALPRKMRIFLNPFLLDVSNVHHQKCLMMYVQGLFSTAKYDIAIEMGGFGKSRRRLTVAWPT